MIRRGLATFILITGLLSPAAAQERVTVGTLRDIANSALFLGAARGYFKAEGIELDMTAYPSDKDVAVALAAGAVEIGIARFSPEAFIYAGRGSFAAIAAQAREKEDYDGSELIASNAAYEKGLQKPEHLAGRSAAIVALGTASHYQFGRVAGVKGFDFSSITLKPMGSNDAVAQAIASGAADAAILPGDVARSLLTSNQAKLIAWYSQLDERQLGAVFASAKTIHNRRATVDKFLRAYRRGAADFHAALMRKDKYGKRITSGASRDAAAQIARYVYPGKSIGGSLVEADALYIDANARLDAADVARQVRWYQAQGLVEKGFNARDIVDSSFE